MMNKIDADSDRCGSNSHQINYEYKNQTFS